MQNLEAVQGEIKAIGALPISTTAKFVGTISRLYGVTSPAQLAELTGLPKSTLYRAWNEFAAVAADIPTRPTSEIPTIPTFPTDGNPTSPTDGNCSQISVPPVPPVGISALARVEYNSSLTSLEDTPVNFKNPLPPSKTKSGLTPADALKAFEAYNATALACSIPQASRLTPDRQRKIIARLREFGADGWARALANIEKSSFLTGSNDRGFRADLDFLLQAKSFARVHDGGYGNGRHAQIKLTAHQRNSEADERRRNELWLKENGLLS